MTNEEKIRKKFSRFAEQVRSGAVTALDRQMREAMASSLDYHKILEGNHNFHLETSDTHGYAVAMDGEVMSSGYNGDREEYGAAERARNEAMSHGGICGTFLATTYHPIINMPFEEQVQSMTKEGVAFEFPHITFPDEVRKALKKR